jgi:hypothetical protein
VELNAMRVVGLIALLLTLVVLAVVIKNEVLLRKPSSIVSPQAVSVPEVAAREQALRLQQQVRDEVQRAMQERASQMDQAIGASKP